MLSAEKAQCNNLLGRRLHIKNVGMPLLLLLITYLLIYNICVFCKSQGYACGLMISVAVTDIRAVILCISLTVFIVKLGYIPFL